ncbi:MAG: 1-deoxy-D-xylulose-5-phosphate synthase [Verrucomicrobia bacterium]|nr:1-deoxy-D-xylulose-5-phosphate synthase [Verrucomicrobiota bacterium]
MRVGTRTRIMYIERKAGSLTGDARIGRVTFNKSGRTIFYRDQVFRRIVGGGFKSNYCDDATGEEYWISGAKKKGGDRLYGERLPIIVDDDVREEYWTSIRGMPERITDTDAQR